MNAEQAYEQELEKLRLMATAGRDFTLEGELAWGRQLIRTKDAYLTMCYGERKERKVWA